MPKNNIALYGALGIGESRAIIAKAKPVFSELAKQIAQGNLFHEAPVSLFERFLSGPFHALYYRFYINDKGFKVSDACVSCSKCAKRCPLNNIDMVDGKPVWRGNCTHCMACICGCPTEAIEYKFISKGKRRHYIMKDQTKYSFIDVVRIYKGFLAQSANLDRGKIIITKVAELVKYLQMLY